MFNTHCGCSSIFCVTSSKRDEKLFSKIAKREKLSYSWLFLANDELLPLLLTERFLNYALIVFINSLRLFRFNFAAVRRLANGGEHFTELHPKFKLRSDHLMAKKMFWPNSIWVWSPLNQTSNVLSTIPNWVTQWAAKVAQNSSSQLKVASCLDGFELWRPF